MIKVRKVCASVQLNYHQVNQNVQEAIYRAAYEESVKENGTKSQTENTKDPSQNDQEQNLNASTEDAQSKQDQSSTQDGDTRTDSQEKTSEDQKQQPSDNNKTGQVVQVNGTVALANFEEKLIRIQRLWRAKRVLKYQKSYKLSNIIERRQKLYNSVINQKYHRMQNSESNFLQNETKFMLQNKNVEGYFWKQMINYAKDLETKAAKIEQRVQSDFVMTDWNLNPASKVWTNEKFNLRFPLERGESQSLTTLKEKIVHYYVQNQLPDEEAIDAGLGALVNSRNAI